MVRASSVLGTMRMGLRRKKYVQNLWGWKFLPRSDGSQLVVITQSFSPAMAVLSVLVTTVMGAVETRIMRCRVNSGKFTHWETRVLSGRTLQRRGPQPFLFGGEERKCGFVDQETVASLVLEMECAKRSIW
jgi:hypothetical protein